ncbi:hypothetical protein BRC93_09035 [Halobacteriales archaeon QS_5_70_15]|nr:MAG: hypothetical protein BRC93_09035 [Halobacteriales archaeon QS_5_70_15]
MFASSLLLDGRSTRHLIDATPDVRFQIRGDALDGVFLTREHLGHLPGLLYFGPEALAATGLTVHCTPRLGEFIATNDPFARLSEEGHIVLDPVRPGSTVDIGGVDGTFWGPGELDRYGDVPHPAISHSMDVLDPTRTEIYFTHLNHTNPVLQPGSEERRRVEERGFHVADRADSFGLG